MYSYQVSVANVITFFRSYIHWIFSYIRPTPLTCTRVTCYNSTIGHRGLLFRYMTSFLVIKSYAFSSLRDLSSVWQRFGLAVINALNDHRRPLFYSPIQSIDLSTSYGYWLMVSTLIHNRCKICGPVRSEYYVVRKVFKVCHYYTITNQRLRIESPGCYSILVF